jgi:fibronectin-binding autotransporter adhesin
MNSRRSHTNGFRSLLEGGARARVRCLAFIAACVASSATAANITWSGTTTASWSNPANWAGGVLPGASDNAILSSGSQAYLTLSSTFGPTLTNLTVSTNSLRIFGNTGVLNVSGSVGVPTNAILFNTSGTSPTYYALQTPLLSGNQILVASNSWLTAGPNSTWNLNSIDLNTDNSANRANFRINGATINSAGTTVSYGVMLSRAPADTSTLFMDSGTLSALRIGIGRQQDNFQNAGTGTLEWTGGLIANYSGGDLLMNSYDITDNYGFQINLIGTGDKTLSIASGRTARIGPNSTNFTTGGVITGTNTAGAFLTGSTGRLVIDGSGTVRLYQSNSYSGQMKINAGTLTLVSGSETYNSVAGTYNATITPSALEIATSGTLDLQNGAGLIGSGSISFTGGALRFTGTSAADLSSRILGSSGAIRIDTGTNTPTFSSALGASNTGGLDKSGAGTLSLTAANTYTGPTTVSAGTLQIGGGGTTGSIVATSTVTVAGGAALNFRRTDDYGGGFANVVSGSGGVQVLSGTLAYTGANTYTGTTTVSAGTLRIGNGGTTGSIAASSPVAVSSGAILSFNRTDGYGGNFANVISGSGGVQVLSGTLAYTGANTYTGTTTVSAGTLQIGNGTTGSIAGPVANGGALVFNRSNDLTYAGIVSGSGTLTHSGAGTLTLSGSSTYTGKTAIANASGGISINSIGNVNGGPSALGNPDSVANGTIDVAGALTYSGGAAATDRRINLGNGATVGRIIHTGSNTLTLNGDIFVNVTSNWSLRPNAAGSEIRVNGLVSGSGASGLFVFGDSSGTATLANSGNSFTGPVNLYQGTLNAASIANSGSNSALGAGNVIEFGNSGSNLTGRLVFTGSAGGSSNRLISILGGTVGTGFSNGGIIENSVAGQTLTLTGSVTASGATPSLQIGGAGDGVLSGAISDGAGDMTLTKIGVGSWTLSGSNAYSGATTVSQGVLRFGSVNAINSTSAVSVAAGGTLAYSGNAAGTFTRSISGSGGFAHAGSGILTITSSNSFTGPTTVSAGVLQIGSTGRINATSQITVDGTSAGLAYNSATPLAAALNLVQGTLSGTGSIGTPVTIGSGDFHSPGNSPGIQSVAAETWNPGGAYIWELNSISGTAGTNYDQIGVTGLLDLAGLSTSNRFNLNLVTLTGGNAAGPLDVAYVSGPTYTFTIATFGSLGVPGSGGFSTAAGSDLTSLFTIDLAGWQGTKPSLSDISVKVNASSGIDLVIVPEPGALVLTVLGAAFLGWAGRRRQPRA